MTDRLASLHQLLASSSFLRWPLKVTFYCEDVFRIWEKTANDKTSSGVKVIMDESSKSTHIPLDPNAAKGIHALDVGYSGLKQHLEKSQKLLVDAANVTCTVCSKALPDEGAKCLVCPQPACNAVGHLECFASLRSSPSEQDNFLPIDVKCPSCKATHKWVDLVKEMSLRLRGEAEIKKVFKIRKPRATKKAGKAHPPQTLLENESTDDEQSGDDESPDDALPPEDDWHYISEEEDAQEHDRQLFRSDPSPVQKRFNAFSLATAYSEPIIEDSDWDDAEVVT